MYIYKYTNKITGEVYIGQTVNIKRRQYEHKRCRGGCKRFHDAIKEYGYENFELDILLEGNWEDYDWGKMEDYYINKFESNVIGKGYNHHKGFACSDPKRFKNISDSLKGHIISEETRKKISDSHIKIGVFIDDHYFESIKSAAEHFGFDKRCLAYCLKRNQTRCYKGHKIRYENE